MSYLKKNFKKGSNVSFMPTHGVPVFGPQYSLYTPFVGLDHDHLMRCGHCQLKYYYTDLKEVEGKSYCKFCLTKLRGSNV